MFYIRAVVMQSMAVSAASTVGTASASVAGVTTAAVAGATTATAAAASVSTTVTVVSNAIRICRVRSSESYTSFDHRNPTLLVYH